MPQSETRKAPKKFRGRLAWIGQAQTREANCRVTTRQSCTRAYLFDNCAWRRGARGAQQSTTHSPKNRQRPTEITKCELLEIRIGRDWTRKSRLIPPEIRIGRDWTREPRLIPPGVPPSCASRLPYSVVGASLPPPGPRRPCHPAFWAAEPRSCLCYHKNCRR